MQLYNYSIDRISQIICHTPDRQIDPNLRIINKPQPLSNPSFHPQNGMQITLTNTTANKKQVKYQKFSARVQFIDTCVIAYARMRGINSFQSKNQNFPYQFEVLLRGELIIIERMATDRNKVVQNYVLEQYKHCNPDQSQIWVAKHRILKKNFTLKRIKYPTAPADLLPGASSPDGRDEWNFQNIQRETNILKRLMCEMAPKCHKMIKTSNNIYVVYDQFPPLTLADHLANHRPSRTEKLELMQVVAKALAFLHNRSVLLLNLTPTNIFLKDKTTAFFGDWSMARTAEMQEKVDCSYLTGTCLGVAKEVLEGGKWFYWSDVYSLGCVFQKILRSGLLEGPQPVDKKLEQLISKMMNERAENRPRLEDVLKEVQNLGLEEGSELVDSPRSQDKPLSSLKSISGFKIRHSTSTPADTEDISFEVSRKYAAYLDTPKMNKDETSPNMNGSKSVKSAKMDKNAPDILSVSSRKIETKKSFDLASPLSVNYSRRKKEEEKPTALQLVKIANKKRNLAFFLFQLSQFVLRMWVCPELGYILLKYTLLTLTSVAEEWQRHDHLLPKEKDDFTAIITSERFGISSKLALLKENMGELLSGMQIKKEVELENQISDRFLKDKIIEFGKQMVVFCEQNLGEKASQGRLVECLFKTYMILKKIEEGTYEKFWEKIYHRDYAFLFSQKYLKDERQLGHRYLKSRIAEILRGK